MSGANVIDEFVVALGLDPTGFNSGQKKVLDDFKKLKQNAQQNAKDLEQEGKRGAEYFSHMKREALGLFAVVVGANGLKNFAETTVTSFAAMGRSAQLMGVNVSQLAAFQNMIVRNGGSAASARSELEALAKQMQEWKLTGSTANRGYFSLFGANPDDNPLAIMEKFAKWAPTVSAQTANNVGSAIGLDPETISQMIKGQRSFNDEMERSRKLGVPSAEEIQKTQELQRAWFELRQAVTGDAQVLLEEATPALVAILNAVAHGIEKFPQFTKAVLALGVALGTLNALKTAGTVLGWLMGLGGGGAAASGAGGAGAAVAGAAGPIAAVAAPVAAFLAGIGAFGKVNEGEAETLARMRGRQGPAVDQALGMIRGFEGFKSGAYWDKNAYRAGYGSDTLTDPTTGRVTKVTAATAGVTKAMAEADLRRRVASEYLPRVQGQVGGAWARWDPKTQAALLSMAYNYGSLPASVAKAAASGDAVALASAMQARGVDNKGANSGRRLAEANAVRGAVYASAAPAAGGPVTVNVGGITVNTAATDARGIARDVGGHVRQQLATQVNVGVSG